MNQQDQPPPLVYYNSENEYYEYFCRVYCDSSNPIDTFDGIRVKFYPEQFYHAFYKSTSRIMHDKSIFSSERAKRINWIKWALKYRNADLFKGWNRKRRLINPCRRICVVAVDYIVIIQVEAGLQRAPFITAFIAAPETLRQIRSKPRW